MKKGPQNIASLRVRFRYNLYSHLIGFQFAFNPLINLSLKLTKFSGSINQFQKEWFSLKINLD